MDSNDVAERGAALFAAERYSEAATVYLSAGLSEAAAAAAVLAPSQTRQMLKTLSLQELALGGIIDSVLVSKLLDADDAELIAQNAPVSTNVMRLVSEYNVGVACECSESIHLTTLQKLVLGSELAGELVPEMISKGKLNALIDEPSGIVFMSQQTPSGRQASALRAHLEQVEVVVKELPTVAQ